MFDEFVVGVVVVFVTTGVSSAANAKLSWSYASIAATAEKIAVADKTFNNVVFFIVCKDLLYISCWLLFKSLTLLYYKRYEK